MTRPESKSSSSPRDVYRQAIAVPEGVQRQQLIEELCAGDAALLSRVEQLLYARARTAKGLLARAVGTWKPDVPEVEKEAPQPETRPLQNGASGSSLGSVGPYELLEVIGEGGMGTVYRARQRAPIEREVAVKLIKQDRQTPEVQTRFAKERQTLAFLEHPNIAQIFDGGETEDGNQFFVMELVRGVALTEYCARRALPIEDRLKLFADLGRAIQHAHSRHIIHRDLKPNNVLVADVDDRPLLKVIDFGIAKSSQEALQERGQLTSFDQILGTPLYMAPEQIANCSDQIDARCDIYALGVILYELLAGSPPFDHATLAQVGYSGFLALLHEQRFMPPTLRARSEISSRGESNDARSAAQQLSVAVLDLPRRRQQELDWIVLRALEASPDQRYGSVSALLDDLERFLGRQPVLAGPASRRNRIRRWMFRQRTALLFAGAVLLAVAGGFGVAQYRSRGTPGVLTSASDRDPESNWQEAAKLQQAVAAFRKSDYASLQNLLLPSPSAAELAAVATQQPDQTQQPQRREWGGRFDLLHMLRSASAPLPLLHLPNSQNLQAAAYSPQAERMVVADREGNIYLYSFPAQGLPEPWVLIGRQPGRIDAIAISPDGSQAVSGTDSLWFWNLDERRLDHEGVWLDAGIETIVWSPDGQTVAAGARYEATWVGDRDGRELFRVQNDHRHESLLFTPDSTKLLIPTREGIDEYDLESRQHVRTISVSPLENVRTMCWAGADNEWLVAAERFVGEALVIDRELGNVLGHLNLSACYPQCLRTTGQGKWLASTYADGRCELIRLSATADGRVQGKTLLQFSALPEPLADDSRVEFVWLDPLNRFFTLGANHPAQLWDWSQLSAVEVRQPPMDLMASFPGYDNQLVFFPREPPSIAQRAYFLSLDSPRSNLLGERLAEPKELFSNLSDNHFLACLGEVWVEILDLSSGKILAQIELLDLPGEHFVSISRDGATAACANDAGVHVWRSADQWESWSQVAYIRQTEVTAIALTDQGQTVLVDDGHAVVEIDVATGKPRGRYENARHAATWRLDTDKDGKLLVGATRNSILVWRRANQSLLQELPCESQTMCIRLAAENTILLSGHRDGTIRAWHLATGQPMGILFQPQSRLGSITRLDFFPDSHRIHATAMSGDQVTSIIIGN